MRWTWAVAQGLSRERMRMEQDLLAAGRHHQFDAGREAAGFNDQFERPDEGDEFAREAERPGRESEAEVPALHQLRCVEARLVHYADVFRAFPAREPEQTQL